MPGLDQAKVIVATADDALYAAIARAAAWNAQHQARSITQLWQEVSDGSLDPASHFVVLAGDLPEGDAATAAALAAIPKTARLFFAETRPGSWRDVETQVHRHLGEGPLGITALTGDYAAMAAQMVQAIVRRPPAPAPAPLPPAAAEPVDDGLGASELRGDLDNLAVDLDDLDVPVPPPAQVPNVYPSEPTPQPMPQPPSAVPADLLDPPGAMAVGGHRRSLIPAPAVHVAPVEDYLAATTTNGHDEPFRDPGTTADNFDPELLAGDPLPEQETILVVSSKGGAGKSTTAITLASAIKLGSRSAVQKGLASREARVIVVDMDVRDGQLGTLAGLYTPTALNIRRAAHVNERAVRANILTTGHLGIDVLLAPNRPRAGDDVGPVFYRTLIRVLKRMYDVVILDGSVNYLDPLLGGVCVPESTRILLVSTPFSTSVHGVGRAVEELTGSLAVGGLGVPRSKIGLVVNMATGNIETDQRDLVAATQSVQIVACIPTIQQYEMLEATNTSRMDLLLHHPKMAPAFFGLARMCAPAFPIAELDAAVVLDPAARYRDAYPVQTSVAEPPPPMVRPVRVAAGGPGDEMAAAISGPIQGGKRPGLFSKKRRP